MPAGALPYLHWPLLLSWHTPPLLPFTRRCLVHPHCLWQPLQPLSAWPLCVCRHRLCCEPNVHSTACLDWAYPCHSTFARLPQFRAAVCTNTRPAHAPGCRCHPSLSSTPGLPPGAETLQACRFCPCTCPCVWLPVRVGRSIRAPSTMLSTPSMCHQNGDIIVGNFQVPRNRLVVGGGCTKHA